MNLKIQFSRTYSVLKKPVLSCLFILSFLIAKSQSENIFLSRDFWKKNPNISEIDSCIALGNDITELNSYKFDPVCWAILEKVSIKTIKYLISIDGNGVNKRTHDGRTYIFWAAYKNNVELMEYLVQKGAHMDIIDSHGYSLINFSATTGQLNTKIYDLCFVQGADIHKQLNNDGANPLLLIVPFVQSPDQLTYFIEKGLTLQSLDKFGNNAFSYACKTANFKIMEYLLKQEVNPKSNNGNAVIFACKGTRSSSNSIQVFKYLDSLNVNMIAKNEKNQNALHLLALRTKDINIIDFLLSKNVPINAIDNDGNSPLANSVKRNSPEMITHLIKNGADLSYKDKSGNSLMHIAVDRSSEIVVNLLKKHNCNLNAYNNDGLTPFHLAAMKSKNDKLLKFLIELGANKELKTSFGESAYDLASENELLNNAKINIEFLK